MTYSGPGTATVKLIILDRDGVINEDSDEYIKSPQEWKPIPGSLEAVARLNQAGYQVTVATNQSGIARGLFDIDALNAIHQTMAAALRRFGGHIDGIFFCPHGPDAHCNCRKPAPGLLLAIAERFGLELDGVPVIGDSLRDLQAARAAGARPILVRTGKGERTLQQQRILLNDTPIFGNLSAVADFLLKSDSTMGRT